MAAWVLLAVTLLLIGGLLLVARLFRPEPTWEEQLEMMRASVEALAVQLGQAFIPAVTAATAAFEDFAAAHIKEEITTPGES